MNEPYQQPEPLAEVIHEMRAMVRNGASVAQLVDRMQGRTGSKPDACLPVIWYFRKAFNLPLKVVLPLREWLLERNDEEINDLLLPEIAKAMAEPDVFE